MAEWQTKAWSAALSKDAVVKTLSKDPLIDQCPSLTSEQIDLACEFAARVVEWSHEIGIIESKELAAICDAHCLRRYIRARKWDVDKALASLKETLQWRLEFGVASLITSHGFTLRKHARDGKMYVLPGGYDKLGHPIVCMHPAREPKANQVHQENINYLIYTMERALAAMDTKKGVEKLVIVIDFQNYSMFNAPPMKTSFATLNILMNHYVERLHKAYMYCPPWAFWAFWKVITPFMDPVTLAKIVFVKGKAQERLDILSETIDPSILGTAFEGPSKWDFLNDGELDAYMKVDQDRLQLICQGTGLPDTILSLVAQYLI